MGTNDPVRCGHPSRQWRRNIDEGDGGGGDDGDDGDDSDDEAMGLSSPSSQVPADSLRRERPAHSVKSLEAGGCRHASNESCR